MPNTCLLCRVVRDWMVLRICGDCWPYAIGIVGTLASLVWLLVG